MCWVHQRREMFRLRARDHTQAEIRIEISNNIGKFLSGRISDGQ